MNSSISTVGKHFVVGLSGTRLTPEEGRALAELRPAGVILFAANIAKTPDWCEQLHALVSSIQSAVQDKTCLISIDHEGGKVFRLPSPATKFPAAENWTGNVSAVARAMGRELHSLGINLNFAPVADIHSEPTNPIIGARAFSSEPQSVAADAIHFLRALEAQGVAGCAKHFPGHGATTKDSHLELPVVSVDRSTLDRRELLPFRALIAENIKLIMTAHVIYPALDPQFPATISKKILTDLLRVELGYEGAVISDALEMKALSTIPQHELIEQALVAGVDLLLLGQSDLSSPVLIAANLAEGFVQKLSQSSELTKTHRQSLERIEALRSHVATLQAKAPAIDKSTVGCAEHTQLCETLKGLATA